MLHKTPVRLTACALFMTILGTTACSSTSGPSAGPLNPAVPASSPPTPPRNNNIAVLDTNNPANALAVDETFTVAGAFLTTRTNAAGGQDLIASNQSTFRDPAGTVFYDASTGSLTFDFAQGDIDVEETFGPLILSNPDAQDLGDFISIRGSNGSVFAPLNIETNNAGVLPRYVVLGQWSVFPVDAQPGDISSGATVFGNLTAPEEVPTVGTASYDTTIAGYVLRAGADEFLTGSVNMDVDFGSRTIDFSVDTEIVTFGPDAAPVFTPFVSLDGDGLLTGGNRFSGNIIGRADPSLRGDVDGAFFGPRAAEVGGTLRFGNDDIQAIGAFVGTNSNTGATQ